MSNIRLLSALRARKQQAQAARAIESGKSGVRMNDQPAPQRLFTSLDESILSPDMTPTVRAILVGSARANPMEALKALKQMESIKPEERQPIGLAHTLQLSVPPELFLSAAEEMRAAARETLGL